MEFYIKNIHTPVGGNMQIERISNGLDQQSKNARQKCCFPSKLFTVICNTCLLMNIPLPYIQFLKRELHPYQN